MRPAPVQHCRGVMRRKREGAVRAGGPLVCAARGGLGAAGTATAPWLASWPTRRIARNLPNPCLAAVRTQAKKEHSGRRYITRCNNTKSSGECLLLLCTLGVNCACTVHSACPQAQSPAPALGRGVNLRNLLSRAICYPCGRGQSQRNHHHHARSSPPRPRPGQQWRGPLPVHAPAARP